jgi:hypothetical protein
VIEQLHYNAVLYLIGYLLLLGSSLPLYLRHAMAYFSGMALWAIASVFLIVASVRLSTISVLAACALVIVLVIWFRRREIVRMKGLLRGEIFWFFVGLSFFLALNVALFHLNLLNFSRDSFSYIGLGESIAKSGYFPSPGMHNSDILYFVQKRLIFLAMLIAGSYLFGVSIYSTLFPLTALSFLPVFVMLFFVASKSINPKRFIRLVLGMCGALLIADLPAYLYQAYYVNNNLLVSVFYSIGLFSVFIYDNRREKIWVTIAALTLACTMLLRNEMCVFSLIPISLFMSIKGLDRGDYRLFLFILVSVSLPWYLFKLRYLGLGNYLPYGNGEILQIFVFLGYGVSYVVVHFDATRNGLAVVAPKVLITTLAVFLIGCLYYLPLGSIKSINFLLHVISGSKGVHDWGVIWLAFAIAAVIGLAFVENRESIFWIQAVVAFFLMRVILYSVFEVLSDSHVASGSRILLHILPAGVCYILLLLAHELSELSLPQEITGEKVSVDSAPDKMNPKSNMLPLNFQY